ncbi:MAG: phospholipase D-like domain-containing protein, partial [Armatimonadetes bacterium]|nr:phospholipase D-like domain-containing protein [Armatimonadota bacterium]
MQQKSLPDLVDNQRVTEWEMAGALKLLLSQSDQPFLSVATAYFNIDALKCLEPEIHKVAQLRLLVGKEQEQAFVLTEKLFQEVQRSLSEAKDTPEELQRWCDFLAQDKVEIRVYRKGFLHGKAYLIEGIPTLGAVGFVGSSNFTGAGLTTNLELN